MTTTPDLFEQIAAAGLADVTHALRQGKTMEYVRRFAVGDEPPAGPTEAYEARRAEALLGRLLELVENGDAT